MLVSLIVPTFNKARELDKLLESIAAQDFPKDCYETLIVDDGSCDHTAKVATAWVEREPNVHYFFKRNGGVASARNEGLRHSKAKFVAFLADDYNLPRDYCRRMLEVLANEQIDVVKPWLDTRNGNTVQRLSLFVYQYNLLKNLNPERFARAADILDCLPQAPRRFLGTTDISGGAMMRRDLFLRIGEFSENLLTGEDSELGIRAAAAGLRIEFNPLVTVQVKFRSGMRSFFRRSFEYGYGSFLIKVVRPEAPYVGPATLSQLIRKALVLPRYVYEVCRRADSVATRFRFLPYFYLRSLCYSAGYWYASRKNASSRA